MVAIVELIAPVFLLIALGYAATFTPVFDTQAGKALSAFVFYFAIPVMLFRSVAQTDPPEANAGLLLAVFYGSTIAVFALGALLSRALFRVSFGEATMLGFGSCYGNIVLIGVPVVLTVLGPEAGFPLFLIISFNSLVMFTSITVLMESSRGGRGELRRLPWKIATGVLGNPIILGLVAGVAVNRLGLVLPPVVDAFAELLGRAAIPCALFATGAALSAFSIRGALPRATLLLAIKGLVHPLLVWWLCAHVLDLNPSWTAVAVVLAAMPVGVNPYLFAARYGVGEAETATAVALSTPLAVLTVTIALWAVGVP